MKKRVVKKKIEDCFYSKNKIILKYIKIFIFKKKTEIVINKICPAVTHGYLFSFRQSIMQNKKRIFIVNTVF